MYGFNKERGRVFYLRNHRVSQYVFVNQPIATFIHLPFLSYPNLRHLTLIGQEEQDTPSNPKELKVGFFNTVLNDKLFLIL
jgi:hypothetical protein